MSNLNKNGEYIFITTDPLGKEVRLKSSTWYNHVTAGDHNRTEFSNEEETIKKCIEDPYYILPNTPGDKCDTRQKYIDLVSLSAFDKLKCLVIVTEDKGEYNDIVTMVAKSKVSESTKGGFIYVRGKSTVK